MIKTITNTKMFQFLVDYLETCKTTYLTDKFGYTSYNKPNTMFNIHNDLPDLLLTLNSTPLRMYIKCLSLIKRSHEPTAAITISFNIKDFDLSRSAFYSSKKELIDAGLLIKTPKPSVMIINVHYANKLFKPKFDDPFDDVK